MAGALLHGDDGGREGMDMQLSLHRDFASWFWGSKQSPCHLLQTHESTLLEAVAAGAIVVAELTRARREREIATSGRCP